MTKKPTPTKRPLRQHRNNPIPETEFQVFERHILYPMLGFRERFP